MFAKKSKDSLVAIQELILDSSTSISDILRRAKVLASQLKNQEFKNWVHNELNGYPEGSDLPDYRFIHTPPLGKFTGPFGAMVKDYLLPTIDFPEGLQEMAKKIPLVHQVKELEGMSIKETLRYPWPTEAVMFLREHISMTGGYVLVEVYQPINNASIRGILDAVRNRLLDFILEIKELAPGTPEGDTMYDELPPDMVSQIFNITIHGDHNILASGKSVTQHATQIVGEGRQDDLKEYLQNLGIEKEDIKELLSIVTDEKVEEKGKFGPGVSSWIGRMITKAASGAWNIALATAPSILAKGISSYYGLE